MAKREQLITEIENLRKHISARLEMIDGGKLQGTREFELTEQMIDNFTER